MYRKYLKPQDLIRHKGSEFYWKKKIMTARNHQLLESTDEEAAVKEIKHKSSVWKEKSQENAVFWTWSEVCQREMIDEPCQSLLIVQKRRLEMIYY